MVSKLVSASANLNGVTMSPPSQATKTVITPNNAKAQYVEMTTLSGNAAAETAPYHRTPEANKAETIQAVNDLESAPLRTKSDANAPALAGASRGLASELQDQTNLLPFKQLVMVLIGLAIAIFVSNLDQTIVSTALPQIGADFNAGQQSEWIGTSYLVTSTVFQPMYGRFSDIFGRKMVLLFTLVAFLIGSLLCAIAQNMTQLIAFRAITGIGGGGVITLVMIIVTDVVAMRDRGKYQGIIGAVVILGNSIGPVIGGAFTTSASWRDCFWLAVPLSGVAILVVVILLPLKSVQGDIKTKLQQVDYAGTLLSLCGTMGILLPLSWGGTSFAWNSAAVIVPFVLGGVLLLAYLIVEWRFAKFPNMPLNMFKNLTVAGVQLATFLSGCAFYVQLYYLPLYFQVVRGDSSVRSGVLLIPLIVLQTVFNLVSGTIVSKTGKYRAVIYIGFAIWTVGLGLISTLNGSSTVGQQVGYLILTGVGAGQTFQTTLIAAQAAVPRNQMAVVTGTRNFLRMLGGTVALAACEAILNNTVKLRLTAMDFTPDLITTITLSPTSYGSLDLSASQLLAVQSAFNAGIQNVFRLCYPSTAVAFFVSVSMIKQYSLSRGDEKDLKAQAKQWAQTQRNNNRSKSRTDTTTSELEGPGVNPLTRTAENEAPH